MTKVTVAPYDPVYLDRLAAIEGKVQARYPDFPSWAGWMYPNSPEVKPDNMFIAFDGDEPVGYGHLIPRPAYDNDPLEVPHVIYLDFVAAVDAENSGAIRDALFAALQSRAGELLQGYSERKAELCIQYYSTIAESIADMRARGFEQVESYHLLERDLQQPIAAAEVRSGFHLREWKMETLEEKNKFLALNKLAFPDESPTLEKLEEIMSIPGWKTFAAFGGNDEVAGLIMFRSESETHGYIDDIFVLPQWRRQGLADALVSAGLQSLKDDGFAGVRLNVAGSNVNAVNLYRKAGFGFVKDQLELRQTWSRA